MMRRAPVISVIIPAYSRLRALRCCLSALAAQDLAAGLFEVIVVDDGSEVPLAPDLQDMSAVFPLSILRQTNAGPATARNLGADAATAPLLAFTDDDCRPRPGWLRALTVAADAEPTAMFGGATCNALAGNVFAQASQDLVDHLQAYHQRTRGSPVLLTSNNLAVGRILFLAMGGFDPSFPMAAGEDRDLCERWLRQGRALRLVPDAVVDHAHDLSLRRFWRQQHNYGRGGRQAAEAAKRQGADPMRIDPVDFLPGLLLHPLRTRAKGSVLERCALLALSQVAVASGYAFARPSRRTPSSR